MMQLEHLKIISRKRPCGSGRLCYRNCSSLIFVLADTSASGRSVSASDSTIDFLALYKYFIDIDIDEAYQFVFGALAISQQCTEITL